MRTLQGIQDNHEDENISIAIYEESTDSFSELRAVEYDEALGVVKIVVKEIEKQLVQQLES